LKFLTIKREREIERGRERGIERDFVQLPEGDGDREREREILKFFNENFFRRG